MQSAQINQIKPPLDTDGLRRMAQQRLTTDPISAVLCCAKLMESAPQDPEAHRLLSNMPPAQRKQVLNAAGILARKGEIAHALAICTPLCRAWPKDPDFAAFEARCLIITKSAPQALERLAPLLRKHPTHAALQITYGLALAATQDSAGAVKQLGMWHKAGRLDPEATNALGACLAIEGDLDQARDLLLSSARKGALNISGIYNLSRHADLSGESGLIAQLELALQSEKTTRADKEMAAYALSRAAENAGDSDRAFALLEQANALRPETEIRQYMDGIRATCAAAPALVDQLAKPAPAEASDTPRPIFIVGAPRSGTTLIEQVLLDDPTVRSIGESPLLGELYNEARDTPDMDLRSAYRQVWPKLPGTCQAVLDKMPPNAFVVGLALATMPEARVIHCRRHPMASGFSAYALRFTEGHNYAYRFDTIAEYHRLSEQIMAEWQARFPDRVFTLPYEALTEDPDHWIAATRQFCGLSAEHTPGPYTGSRKPVHTASLGQVRKDIYKGSSDKWRRYATQLTPLQNVMSDLIAAHEALLAQATRPQAQNPDIPAPLKV